MCFVFLSKGFANFFFILSSFSSERMDHPTPGEMLPSFCLVLHCKVGGNSFYKDLVSTKEGMIILPVSPESRFAGWHSRWWFKCFTAVPKILLHSVSLASPLFEVDLGQSVFSGDFHFWKTCLQKSNQLPPLPYSCFTMHSQLNNNFLAMFLSLHGWL